VSEVVIRAQGLGKRYLIGHQSAERERYTALRDVLGRSLKGIGRYTLEMVRGRQIIAGDEVEEFWALKDVSFEIKRGEVVGIIGRNGAGKSTLLKILSRITEPSAGSVEIKGRVASLLGVGTGFHPELTGYENIYLNGAILGMSRAEIRKKFDEIVAFGDVEKFLDTPVKRYSSGMSVRLAFAVAAHLEPEILVVDEVLAVGDAEFQKKCLGKMQDVSKGGRTVLFVSHSMGAVRALCSRGIVLASGKIGFAGDINVAVDMYLKFATMATRSVRWSTAEAPGNQEVRLLGIDVAGATSAGSLSSSEPIHVTIDVQCYAVPDGLCVGFELISQDGVSLFWSYQNDGSPDGWPPLRIGRNLLRCHLPARWFNAGEYLIAPRVGVHNSRWIINIPPCVAFSVELAHGVSPYWTSLSATSRRRGELSPILHWELHDQTGSKHLCASAPPAAAAAMAQQST
jgi:lipopolysaccharide transport system ATP-binding protein